MSAQLATFSAGGYLFGVDVLRVQEILRRQPVTSVPTAHSAIRGLINLRGQLVVAIDLRDRLGLEKKVNEFSTMNVIVRTVDGLVAMIVDEIRDVLTVDCEPIESESDVIPPEIRNMTLRTYHVPDGLLLQLNLDRVLVPEAYVDSNQSHYSALRRVAQ